MADNRNYEMTREGYDALVRELEELKTVKRKENSEMLKEAISYGDISENAEYDAAKEAQAKTEDRINEIEDLLRRAKVVDEDEHDVSKVATGRTVTLKDLVYDEVVIYKIVGNSEADPFNGKLSNESEVGRNLLGHEVGETIEFAVPEGKAIYKILEIVK